MNGIKSQKQPKRVKVIIVNLGAARKSYSLERTKIKSESTSERPKRGVGGANRKGFNRRKKKTELVGGGIYLVHARKQLGLQARNDLSTQYWGGTTPGHKGLWDQNKSGTSKTMGEGKLGMRGKRLARRMGPEAFRI